MTRSHTPGMNRRRLLQIIAALPFARGLFGEAAAVATAPFSRVRPGDPKWPSVEIWEELGHRLDGQLIKVSPPPSAYPAKPAIERELQNQDIHRSIVLMIDDSAAHSEPEVLSVVSAGKQFIKDQMQPSDLVAVTASRGEMGIYQQFTNDKRQIIAALDHVAHRPGYGMWEVDPPDVFDEKTGSFVPMPLAVGEPQYGYRAAPPPNPIGHLAWAIQSLQNAPGRKAVVLFTDGLGAPSGLVFSAR